MKPRVFIMIGLLAAIGFCAMLLRHPPASKERRALEKTQKEMRAQGFKTSVDEFNFSAPTELRQRGAVLTNTFLNARMPQFPGMPFAGFRPLTQLMPVIGSNSVEVLWKKWRTESWAANEPQGAWESRDLPVPDLSSARAAIFSENFAFGLNARAGASMLLPHLAAVRGLSVMFRTRTLQDLSDGQRDSAWTNMLVTTRLTTGWEIEPVEISWQVRFACLDITYGTIWQTLQAGNWPDERLAGLQHELEAADFLRGLPETAAFARASDANIFEQDRQMPVRFPLTLAQLMRAPGRAWSDLVYYWQQVQYRNHGSFSDENQILLCYRDREAALRQALQLSSWAAIRELPGITNAFLPKPRSNFASRAGTIMNLRQMQGRFGGGPSGLAGQAAVAEAKRRLLITAIALERFHGRTGFYPETLSALTPEFLPHPPADFMDGKPLRYARTDDGHFVLYSPGHDCVDHGGTMIAQGNETDIPFPYGGSARMNRARFALTGSGADLVWPRPASDAEMLAWEEKQRKKQEEELAALQAAQKAFEATESYRKEPETEPLADPPPAK